MPSFDRGESTSRAGQANRPARGEHARAQAQIRRTSLAAWRESTRAGLRRDGSGRPKPLRRSLVQGISADAAAVDGLGVRLFRAGVLFYGLVWMYHYAHLL